jgi:transposase-like protein
MRREPAMAKRKRRSIEFKAEAARPCSIGDRSIGQIANELDLTESALPAWVERAEVDNAQGAAGVLTTAGARSWEELGQGTFVVISRSCPTHRRFPRQFDALTF